MSGKWLLIAALATAGAFGIPALAQAEQAAPAEATAVQTPVQVVQSIADQLATAIDGHRAELKADKEKLIGVIDQIFLPQDRKSTRLNSSH